ncbi:MAG: LysM peptidoglycan-binding domain-containing protein [Planctomycetaceae bacterium]|nr:LysM peptidoglycan-binding domain-containing protein [Planctomycetales bacterium]MCB9873920.1 LysM peptidoglycan-binding domain-containing protein [Planctomycetaceae bacterium]MCB9937387.1 LysM peptidoglycan-binding domain-containing protein [Planctomycetaceae bacterium]
MDTLKTAVVVVLLLAVLYGVYVVLNKPEQFPQELAWETGAADPALQIELGTPEVAGMGVDSADTPGLTTGWGAGPQSHAHSTDSHASDLSSTNVSIDRNNASRPGLSENSLANRHSLPIPEATSPAAPAIAAPDLLSDTESPTPHANEVAAIDGSDAAGDSISSPAIPSQPSAYSNELREGAGTPTSIDSPTSRYGDSNRYSDHGSLRSGLTSEVSPAGVEQAPANSTQANVNDDSPSEPFRDETFGRGAVGSSEGSFQSAVESVHAKIEAEAWYDALVKLSSHYTDPNLTADEYSQLIDLLDPLAGKVIYSTEHLIEPAYQAQSGDTLKNIADRYEVPWQLLANINGIENPETLLAGRELKVVRGPFRAEVSLSKNELTLFVGKIYAGRFTISVGNDPAPLPGQYQINDKQPGRTYYAGNGQTIPIDDPNNPYGRVWLDLGNNLCIHGSSPNGASPGQGCIALTARDAGDVYGILSKGSSIVIVR